MKTDNLLLSSLVVAVGIPMSASHAQTKMWQTPPVVPPSATVNASSVAPLGSLTQPGTVAPGSLAPGSLASGAQNSALANGAAWNTGQPAWNMPGKPSLSAQSGSIHPAAAVRLRAAGLDPTAPNFAVLLNERIARLSPPTAAAWNPKIGAAGTSGGGNAALSIRTAFAAKLASMPAAARSAFGGGENSRLSGPVGTPMSSSGTQTLTISGVYGALSQDPLHGPMSVPGHYLLAFNAPSEMTLPTQRNSDGIMHFSIPDCHVESDAFANVETNVVFSQRGSGIGSGKVNAGLAYFPLAGDTAHEGFWNMALGAATHAGTLTLHYANGVASMPMQFSEGYQTEEAHELTVGSSPPLLGAANDMGLNNSAFILHAPRVQRFNATGTAMTGTDTIGVNSPLGAGYSAVAQITASHSVSDVGGDASADNPYRGAVITNQPAAGRLETQVQWHIGPGDSLQYTIQWAFKGPFGQRPLLTMALRGPCDS